MLLDLLELFLIDLESYYSFFSFFFSKIIFDKKIGLFVKLIRYPNSSKTNSVTF